MAKRILAVKILGWIFVIAAVFYIVGAREAVINHYNLLNTFVSGSDFGIWPDILLGSGLMFALLMSAGAGVLLLKNWGYYAALLVPLAGVFNTIWDLWFFGGQYYTLSQQVVLFLVYSFIAVFFLSAKTRAVFGITPARTKNLKSAPKVLFTVVIILTAVHFLSFPLWSIYVKAVYGQYPAAADNRPLQSAHQPYDNDFISNKCRVLPAFEFSMAMPKNLEIGMIYKSKEFGWEAVLNDAEGPDMSVAVFLNSGAQEYLRGFSSFLRFNSLYEFEKRLLYPGYSPFYLALKMSQGLKFKHVEEMAAFNWRGFLKSQYLKEKTLMDCSLYSLSGDRTGYAAIIFKNGAVTAREAKSIFSSIEFTGADRSAESFFNDGQKALEEKDYTPAALNFLSALYREKEPRYAYYLALSLFENCSLLNRWTRLASARSLLVYALNLDPGYQPAKELLARVEDVNRKP